METMSNHQLRRALETLRGLGEACAAGADFAHCGVTLLPRLIASELTTLSTCDLDTGHRAVVSDSPVAMSKSAIEAFDAHFHEHPLVREHGRNPRACTKRINDLVAPQNFCKTPLYADYYRKIGISDVMAVPIYVDRRFLVSFVLNRSGHGFSDGERMLADIMRTHLAYLYRLGGPVLGDCATAHGARTRLTAREREVLDWVAVGKTNRDVAALLGVGVRTVEKHLEHIYEKLGVETRTAAVSRVRKFGAAREQRAQR